jgi:hypothetical protein
MRTRPPKFGIVAAKPRGSNQENPSLRQTQEEEDTRPVLSIACDSEYKSPPPKYQAIPGALA